MKQERLSREVQESPRLQPWGGSQIDRLSDIATEKDAIVGELEYDLELSAQERASLVKRYAELEREEEHLAATC